LKGSPHKSKMLPGEESGKVRAAVILPGQKKYNKKRPAIPADLSAFILFQVKLQCYTAEGNPEDPLTLHYIESLERE